MTTTSADSDDLVVYVDAAGDGTTRLATAAAEVRGALDAFRASEGRAVFLADVPEVDLDLSFLVRRWDRLSGWLDGVARAFREADGGADGPLTLEDRALDLRAGRFVAPEVEVIRRGGRFVLDTGVGGDEVVVRDRGDVLVVIVDGTEHTFALDPDDEVLVRLAAGGDDADVIDARDGLVVDGGSGADDLAVAGRRGLVLRGGAGADELRGGAGADRLLGGEGDDDVVGGNGDDRIIGGDGDDVLDGNGGDDWISAGEGEDLVHGEGGRDVLAGGGGRDHVDGGFGLDRVDGGDGADVLAGGEGHDTVSGAGGDDVAYAGPGHDLVMGGGGADAVHIEPGDGVADATDSDTVHRVRVDLGLLDAITVDVGNPLADRIRADLVTLASTTAGAELLASLQGHEVTVVGPGYLAEAGDAYDPQRDIVQYDPRDDEAGFGPAGAFRPPGSLSYSPLLSLAHELIHASHDANGTRTDGTYRGPDGNQRDTDRDGVVEAPGPGGDAPVANEERATVGLPVDPDGDPATPDVPAGTAAGRDVGVTENDLRDELGLERRGRY
jgi:Ca2+-binding RTX toxin-like protein